MRGNTCLAGATRAAWAAGNEPDGLTTRNRGTDCVKSPEMLLVSNAQKKMRDSYDRRRREGAGVGTAGLSHTLTSRPWPERNECVPAIR